ncbi:hypothetical protein LSH36_881g02030 [Paralvinella palmiformis]|uniref:Uncharacterized protein n=1 Tax=Paralvinella palmiformis TaxID=53620 RepID=A0AAD9MRS7_9ANNE|nr:hypothetical protein LSH36_881g02030 [Paralvinella palmiformis]
MIGIANLCFILVSFIRLLSTVNLKISISIFSVR